MLEQVFNEIKHAIAAKGGQYSDWYVGISKNPGRRLFGDHLVTLSDPTWLIHEAEGSTLARALESTFLTLGCAGGSGGGDDESRFFYAYRMNSETRP